MPFSLQCNITLQDCATLYPSSSNAFMNGSCVPDQRLEGNIGRCGFPGAKCVVDDRGNHNCATRCTTSNGWGCPSSSMCQNGVCAGAAGAWCMDNVPCNWGMSCNGSAATQGICGGANAIVVNTEASTGIDFGKDYCLSGSAFQKSPGSWLCSDGPPMALILSTSSTVIGSSTATPSSTKPVPTTSSKTSSATGTGPSSSMKSPHRPSPVSHISTGKIPAGAIIGWVIGGIVVLLVLVVLVWRKKGSPSRYSILARTPPTVAALVSLGHFSRTQDVHERADTTSTSRLRGATGFTDTLQSSSNRSDFTKSTSSEHYLTPPETRSYPEQPPLPSSSISRPYDADAVERRLMALRDEIERGLTEIRTHRSGDGYI